jgi:hypothetical protein
VMVYIHSKKMVCFELEENFVYLNNIYNDCRMIIVFMTR